MRRFFILVAAVALPAVAGCVAAVRLGLIGRHEGPGEITKARIPAAVVAARRDAQRRAAVEAGAAADKLILFGDLHVHTTFSTDAFLSSLPMLQGEGAHPIADACDYARFCSGLDFWSINDHAEASTPERWRETKDAIRQCNAVAGDPENPDVAAFLGWEWSQVGLTRDDHYGHKNVIFPGLEDDQVPARPIGAGGIATEGLRRLIGRVSPILGLVDFPRSQRYFNFSRFMEELGDVPRCAENVPSPELPPDCYESAATPAELFRKLGEWGFDTMVIPHGNTWGLYSPLGTSWDKQLVGAEHDPDKQRIVEVMSGHGNSEEYREWQEAKFDESGNPSCPEPTKDYLPSCWRAGELAMERCRKRGGGEAEAECAAKAAEARARYVALGLVGHLIVPDAAMEEWLDSGQCRDCFLPAFNYRPQGSTQYSLAVANFDDPAKPRRFRFGLIAASDNHRASPGTGYKEFDRLRTSESSGPRDETWNNRLRGRREDFDPWAFDLSKPEGLEAFITRLGAIGFAASESERQASFFMTGGLAGVHSSGRSREEIWQALKRKEIYGTSGDRILLWFDLRKADGGKTPMGGEVSMSVAPRFEVGAVGAFKQTPGCPDDAALLPRERLEWLCKGECYNPSDERKLVTRIEVVRIRPQVRPGEPVGRLIEDPWKVFPCKPDPAGCVVEFEDPDFAAARRDTVYYVRAIEEPSPAVNGGQLGCRRDEDGNCVSVDPCYGNYRTPRSDDCLATIEERAWSSPIFVDYARPSEKGS